MRTVLKLIQLSFITIACPLSVYAQAQGESFFDKYLPIAELFDSPVFFWSVIGSALGLFAATIFFLRYVKWLERRVEAWGGKKTPKKLVELLESPIAKEKRYAFMYLRSHGGEDEIKLIAERLQIQRKNSKVNPDFIHILEDLRAEKAVQALQQIADSKSRLASLAKQAVERIKEHLEEEKLAKEEE